HSSHLARLFDTGNRDGEIVVIRKGSVDERFQFVVFENFPPGLIRIGSLLRSAFLTTKIVRDVDVWARVFRSHGATGEKQRRGEDRGKHDAANSASRVAKQRFARIGFFYIHRKQKNLYFTIARLIGVSGAWRSQTGGA